MTGRHTTHRHQVSSYNPARLSTATSVFCRVPSCAHTNPAWRYNRRPQPSRKRRRDHPRHVVDTLVILLAWFYGYISAGKLESSIGGVGGSASSASVVSCRLDTAAVHLGLAG